MSSVRNLAVARPFVAPADSTPHSAPRAVALVPPLEEPRSAADGDPAPRLPNALADVWEDLVHGRLRARREIRTPDRVHIILEAVRLPTPANPQDVALLVSGLCGYPRKTKASDLGIATSTATGRILRTLDKLELPERNISLPLVLAAQSWAGARARVDAEIARFEEGGRPSLAVSVPTPVTSRIAGLTRVEQEIARWVIEGLTREEIACLRGTAVYTVSRQIHGVFSAIRETGRYPLILRAAELGCFHERREAGVASTTC